MAQLFANNASSTLASAIAASSSATTITLAPGDGAKFPAPTGSDFFLATLIGLDANGNENAWEIVKVTANASDTLTAVRAYEGIAQQAATALAWAAGTHIELRATAGTLQTLQAGAAGAQTGDILYTGRTPGSGFLKADGSVYAQSSYAALYGVLGILAQAGAFSAGVSHTSGFGTTIIYGVCYGNGLFVAVGDSGTLTTSSDGITWTARTSGFGANYVHSVCYGNGLFVAVGANGVLATSPDGVTWTLRTSGFGTVAISGVCYGNGLFVAVGANGVLATSPDGITWTTRTSGFGTSVIYGVCYGNGLFVAVGASGTLTTSSDGVTWTARTSGFGTNIINDVCYGSGLYVAVGASGTLTTSSDGITWTTRTSGFGASAIYGVCYGSGLYVAVGASGTLTTSSDGITWTTRTSGFGASAIYGVCYGNGLYVAVGASGALFTYNPTSYDASSQFIVPSPPVVCRFDPLHQNLTMQTLYGMDASGVSTGAVKQIDDGDGTTPGWVPVAPPALADGEVAIWAATQWAVQPAPAAPVPVVPTSVTQRQARLALNQAGKLSAVDSAIAALSDPQKTEAQIEWDYASTIDRNSTLVATLGTALGLSSSDLDNLFITASTL